MAGAGECPIIPGSQPVYECAFCGRSFEKGQGLAGHMSIHREGKARNSFFAWPSADVLVCLSQPCARKGLLLACSGQIIRLPLCLSRIHALPETAFGHVFPTR